MYKLKKQSGFVIVELLILFVIIATLTIMLLPNLKTYTSRAKFQDVVHTAHAQKAAAELCYLTTGAFTDCDSGSNGVPGSATFSGTNVAAVSVTDGVITATSSSDLGSKTFILTPTPGSNNVVCWASSGSCTSAALCGEIGVCSGSGGGGGGAPSCSGCTPTQQTTLGLCTPTSCTSGIYYFTMDNFGVNELGPGQYTLNDCNSKVNNWTPQNAGWRIAVIGSCVQYP